MPRKILYVPGSNAPYALSRSRLELYLECPRCFYISAVYGISRVSGPSFALNAVIDSLLKREFDACRLAQKPHAVMLQAGLNAVPYSHPDLDSWRNVRRGIHFVHQATNLELSGSPDDIWQMASDGSLLVVDFKAKGRTDASPITDQCAESYWRQVGFYRWLLAQNGFAMNRQVALLYANASKNAESLNGRLEFSLHLHMQTADDSWIEPALAGARECLDFDRMPEPNVDCPWCRYVEARATTGYSHFGTIVR